MRAEPIEGDGFVIGELSSDFEEHGTSERFFVVDRRTAQDVFLFDGNRDVLYRVGEKLQIVQIAHEEFIVVDFG